MTLDHAVALSLLDDLPRVGLNRPPALIRRSRTARTCSAGLLRVAHVTLTPPRRATRHWLLAWNDPAVSRRSLATITDCPPALWYRGTLDCSRAARGRRSSARAPRRRSRSKRRVSSATISPLAASRWSAVWPAASIPRRTAARSRRGGPSPCSDRASTVIYPSEHRRWPATSTGGAVVSEYPPGTPPLHFTFRCATASSAACRARSWSSKRRSKRVADHRGCALEQGRDVMAVPGNVLSGRNRGGHALIRDGAKIVESRRTISWPSSAGCSRAARRGEPPSAGVSQLSEDPRAAVDGTQDTVRAC